MSDTEVESIPPSAAILRADQFSPGVMQPKRAWADALRERIDAEAAIDALNDHVKGLLHLEPTQVRAAEILLRKKLPDLAAVAVADGGGGGLIIERVFFAKNPNT